MRNALLESGPKFNEAAIINLDDATGRGTHWCAYRKSGLTVTYFDSFGNLNPPKELIEYLGVKKIYFKYERYQDFDQKNCGHSCLKFLSGNLHN